MNKKELILLDARLVSVIDQNAFGAELDNGHRLVCYFQRNEVEGDLPEIGSQVKVELSPYDMSKGRLIFKQE